MNYTDLDGIGITSWDSIQDVIQDGRKEVADRRKEVERAVVLFAKRNDIFKRV